MTPIIYGRVDHLDEGHPDFLQRRLMAIEEVILKVMALFNSF